MPIDYTALKNELNNDPRNYGYAAQIAAGSDNLLAVMLNHRRNGSAPINPAGGSYGIAGSAIVVGRIDIRGREIRSTVDTGEFVTGPTALLGGHYTAAVQSNDPMTFYTPPPTPPAAAQTLANLTANRELTNLQNCFTGNPGTSRNALAALGWRNGSRAEELFGAGTVVSSDDVGRALRATP